MYFTHRPFFAGYRSARWGRDRNARWPAMDRLAHFPLQTVRFLTGRWNGNASRDAVDDLADSPFGALKVFAGGWLGNALGPTRNHLTHGPDFASNSFAGCRERDAFGPTVAHFTSGPLFAMEFVTRRERNTREIPIHDLAHSLYAADDLVTGGLNWDGGMG